MAAHPHHRHVRLAGHLAGIAHDAQLRLGLQHPALAQHLQGVGSREWGDSRLSVGCLVKLSAAGGAAGSKGRRLRHPAKQVSATQAAPSNWAIQQGRLGDVGLHTYHTAALTGCIALHSKVNCSLPGKLTAGIASPLHGADSQQASGAGSILGWRVLAGPAKPPLALQASLASATTLKNRHRRCIYQPHLSLFTPPARTCRQGGASSASTAAISSVYRTSSTPYLACLSERTRKSWVGSLPAGRQLVMAMHGA